VDTHLDEGRVDSASERNLRAAAAIGIDPRSVQRRIAAMERDGLIRREERRVSGSRSNTNIYHLDGLIEAAKPYALEKIQEMKAKAAERAARAQRKGKPKLQLVKAED
jgi:DNA-binding Lrp family transcriptional regulator